MRKARKLLIAVPVALLTLAPLTAHAGQIWDVHIGKPRVQHTSSPLQLKGGGPAGLHRPAGNVWMDRTHRDAVGIGCDHAAP